jgi:hypothetical protein
MYETERDEIRAVGDEPQQGGMHGVGSDGLITRGQNAGFRIVWTDGVA